MRARVALQARLGTAYPDTQHRPDRNRCGGGSIAHVNDLGLLNVGPESSGAVPGPACYGLGGEGATVTDADLMLGYLNPDNFLGGEMKLRTDLARDALQKLATQLKL